MTIRVTVWGENVHEQKNKVVAEVYPKTMHGTIAEFLNKEDGITAIVSLHQLEYARRFADRVVGLADSQIVFDAAPSELTDAQLERIYAGRSTTQPANAPAEPPVMLEPSLEMSR